MVLDAQSANKLVMDAEKARRDDLIKRQRQAELDQMEVDRKRMEESRLRNIAKKKQGQKAMALFLAQ